MPRNAEGGWSPDSNWITFHGHPVTSLLWKRICKVQPDGQNFSVISGNDDFDEKFPRWSSDSLWLSIYQRNPNNPDDYGYICKMRPDGTEKTVLVQGDPDKGETVFHFHNWHPGSLWITYLHWTDSPSIYIVNAETGEIKRITEKAFDDRPWWSPDGNRILFGEYEATWNSRDLGLFNYDLSTAKLHEEDFGVFVYGDINGSLKVDITDVILSLRMSIQLPLTIDGDDFFSPYNADLVKRADINDDDEVNIQDVILTLRKSIGLDF